MKVTEIFFSIQGESSFAGKPCTFVRLSGCSLRCTWCDTEYSFEDGTEMPPDDVIDCVGKYGCKLVEITGGEPLLQNEVYTLIDRLLAEDYTVLIETGGNIHLGKLDTRVIKIMDFKCPGSAMEKTMDISNIYLLTSRDEIKFVILDRNDYQFAKDIISKYNLIERTNVLFSPVHGKLDPRIIAQWILADKLDVRLQVQFHKYIWGEDIRGV